jgi:hypothetical protein
MADEFLQGLGTGGPNKYVGAPELLRYPSHDLG